MMPAREEIEIEIDADGEARVHIKGVKGKRCLEYGTLLERAVGKIVSTEPTPDYYEPDFDASITDRAQRKTAR